MRADLLFAEAAKWAPDYRFDDWKEMFCKE